MISHSNKDCSTSSIPSFYFEGVGVTQHVKAPPAVLKGKNEIRQKEDSHGRGGRKHVLSPTARMADYHWAFPCALQSKLEGGEDDEDDVDLGFQKAVGRQLPGSTSMMRPRSQQQFQPAAAVSAGTDIER